MLKFTDGSKFELYFKQNTVMDEFYEKIKFASHHYRLMKQNNVHFKTLMKQQFSKMDMPPVAPLSPPVPEIQPEMQPV